MGASFGFTRELTFLHDETKISFNFPQKNNDFFGFNDKTCGGHGEYLTITETDAVINMPYNLNFDEAAALAGIAASGFVGDGG